jgi:hypothetical protein
MNDAQYVRLNKKKLEYSIFIHSFNTKYLNLGPTPLEERLHRFNIVHFSCNYNIFTKNQYQLVALYYVFVG